MCALFTFGRAGGSNEKQTTISRSFNSTVTLQMCGGCKYLTFFEKKKKVDDDEL
jgi:hypothetical protein